jgi:hypothetical protein
LHLLKAKIRIMFTSEEWLNVNASKEGKGNGGSQGEYND